MDETKEHILDYITRARDNKLSLYKKDVKLLLEHYNNEVETSKSYHGRQLLELIQNADDQHASDILIILDEDNGTISVSNNGGIPFSKKGYDSLFYAHLSPKQGEEYIGHKGLGLRSILMWGEEFKIISNDIELTFSQKIARKQMAQMLSMDANFKKNYSEESRSYKIKDICPLPVFSCPQVDATPSVHYAKEYTTTIHATFKKDIGILENIKSQISELNSEILLFLPHIKAIRFQGVDKEDIICETKSLKSKTISEDITLTNIKIDGTRWQIYEKAGKLKSVKNKKYQVKLAISDGEFRESYLYCFFPTRVTLNTPYILHGTFELDPTRNGINESVANEEVAKHLAQLIIGVAKYLTSLKRKADWLPLKMLLVGLSNNINLSKIKFNHWINESLSNEAIYPCLDKTYRKISKVTYISDEFSKLIQDTGNEDVFPNMLLPNTINLWHYISKSNIAPVTNIEKQISKVNLDNCSISKRAELIFHLVTHFRNSNFNLLLDSDSRKISKDTTLFSPIDKDIYIPSFCKIRIINRELYNELRRRFNITGANPARELARILGRFNFKAYEPAPLVAKIIDECNRQTSKKKSDVYIKETILALYKNFCNNIITEETNNTGLLLPTQSGGFEKASNLYLSKEFPTGNIAYDIFSHLHSDDEYIKPYSYFEVDKIGNIEHFEQFLIWLGVNPFVKYKLIQSYTDIVNRYLGWENNIVGIHVHTIENLENILRVLSIEQIILWIHSDKFLKKSLSSEHEDKLIYTYYNVRHDKRKDYSLIKDTFKKHGFDFSSFVLEESFQWANTLTIDYASPILLKHSINRRLLQEYLSLLGAKENTEDLSTTNIINILTSMTTNPYFKNGRKSQITYERILNILKDRADVKYLMKDKYDVFASIGKEIIICSNTDCYFSEKIDLPNQLRPLYPIFNYPRRAGGAKAIEIFRINDLSDIEIEITSVLTSKHNDAFREKFNRFKPALLSVRLNSIRSEDSFRKNDKDVLEQLDIRLCSDIGFKAKQEEGILDDYSYILSDGVYYIKVCDTTFELPKDQDRFNGCVASILSSAFRITEEAPFEIILSKRAEDAEEWVSNKYGADILTEAYRRFDRLDSKLEFCKSIKTLLHIPFTNEDLLSEIVINNNNYDLSNILCDYDNLNDERNLVDLRTLFTELHIDIRDFNVVSQREINLSRHHKKNLQLLFNRNEIFFKTSLWKVLSEQDTRAQMSFLDIIHNYTHRHEFIDIDAYCFDVEYDAIWREYVSQYIVLDSSNNAIQWREIEAIHSDNLKTITSLGYDTDDLDTSEDSLLYFPIDNLEQYFVKVVYEKNDNTVREKNEVAEEDSLPLNIIDSKYESVSHSEGRAYTTSDKAFKYKTSKSKKDKKIGESAEKRVYKELQSLYGEDNVIWKSKEDDGAHYDIRYMPSPNVCKYVEVKSFLRGSFDISKDEIAFGREHAEDYEIWLVDEEGAHPIKDFFDSEGKPNYHLNSKSFEVILKKIE